MDRVHVTVKIDLEMHLSLRFCKAAEFIDRCKYSLSELYDYCRQCWGIKVVLCHQVMSRRPSVLGFL